ncbi:MAG: UDP-4-amino-4,6-dideoxy-N-acetyl-beta-L-altrosamine transaminase [Acidobacteriota bacterium]|nr:UDP-4-amino-4,6-dideoxy-N-acetyl-beta-L-altrosamine transaminase [Acidobacteriota bacterium]
MTERRFLPYGKQWLDDEDVDAVAAVLRGDWLTTGPRVDEFEEALAARAGTRHAVAVSSGTAALHTAYFAGGLGEGDEIVVPALTFVATASCALHLGSTVRFADVDPRTGNIDPDSMEEAIGPATRFVVPADYAGHPADYTAIRAVTDRRGVRVVADGAHSFGASYHGKPASALADATATSFHPVKPITTGEGGAVITDDDAWDDRARLFRNHGIVRDPGRQRSPGGAWHYEVQALGLNYRLPDILCALGLSQLKKLDRFLARRREIAAAYTETLAEARGIELPVAEEGVEPGWHLYVIRVSDASRREPVFDFLRRDGVGVQLHYTPVHLHPLYQDLGYESGSCPRAEDFASRAISIPIFPRMTDDDVQRVIDTVIRANREVL